MTAPARTLPATPRPRTAPLLEPEVTILLATRNGAPFLPAQLASLRAQTHGAWSLLASDDGSEDDTAEILLDFALTTPGHPLTLLRGPGRGAAANFAGLVARAPEEAAFAAFCDQDDVWLPGKLARAIAVMEAAGGGAEAAPALYWAQGWACDSDLSPRARTRWPGGGAGFARALVECAGPGHTLVANRAALRLMQRALAPEALPGAHDWWAQALILGAGGRVIADPAAVVLSRRHAGNAVGAGPGLAGRAARARAVADGRFAAMLRANLEALAAAEACLLPAHRATLQAARRALAAPPPLRAAHLARAGLRRASRWESAALLAAAAVGLI